MGSGDSFVAAESDSLLSNADRVHESWHEN